MSSVDLMLRYCIIAAAWHLACAWAQTFQSPYPLVDAFELAGSAEEQLLRSLGISFAGVASFLSATLRACESTARELLPAEPSAEARLKRHATSRSLPRGLRIARDPQPCAPPHRI